MMFLKGTRGVLPVKGTKGRKGRVKKQRRPQRRDDDCRQPWRMRTDKGWPAHCGIISNIYTIYYFPHFLFHIKKLTQADKGRPKAVSITDTEIIDALRESSNSMLTFWQKCNWNIETLKRFTVATVRRKPANFVIFPILQGFLMRQDKKYLNCDIDTLFDALKFMTNAFDKCSWDNKIQLYKDFIL